MNLKEDELKVFEKESNIRLNHLTRKAEDAIRFFKNIALKYVGHDKIAELKL
jgi:hypothetical protein